MTKKAALLSVCTLQKAKWDVYTEPRVDYLLGLLDIVYQRMNTFEMVTIFHFETSTTTLNAGRGV